MSEHISSFATDIEMISEVLISIGQQVSSLFSLVLIYWVMERRYSVSNRRAEFYYGLIFSVATIFAMLTPVNLAPGYFFDLRAVFIFLATVFCGRFAGLMVVVTALSYRFYMGGGGVYLGLTTITWAYLVGLFAYHQISIRKTTKPDFVNYYIFGLILHLLVLILFLFLPGERRHMLLVDAGLPIIIVYPLLTAIASSILCEFRNMKEKNAALQFSEHNLREALDRLREQQRILNDHAIVAETDQAGRITYVNDKFCEISKYSREELIGRNHRLLKSGYHPTEFFEEFWSTISSGQTWQGQVCNRAKDGSIYWVSSTVMPLYRKKRGVISGYISVRTDITEAKRTEAALRQSQKMEAVGELTGGIAHDFNNLLGIIIGNHDLLSRKIEKGSRAERLLEKAQKAALRGANLTKKLLGFSRRSSHEVQTVNVNDVISDLEDLLSHSLTKNVKLEMALDENLWLVDIDSSDLQDSVLNLAINARDAMEGNGTITIETRNIHLDKELPGYQSKIEPGKFVELRITDTGCGIPENIKEKIFEPFYTTKDQGKGTGLG
ncbi:MAG: LytS/YhcK type 5TM receptor domain-containing protein, partial [Alphaproteobacteria bacterium]|nr:LytS/YhcK type 5TM receptor domain-containing protein [Alphaproteobacteria bacterium]